MFPYDPWFGGGYDYGIGIGGGGGTPIGLPFPTGGQQPYPGGGGLFGGIADFVEDIGDIVGGVGDIVDVIRGGSGGGGGGTPSPNPFTGLTGDVGGGDSANLATGLGNQSAAEMSFLEFLKAVGVGLSIINWLWENPPISWPKIALDMFAAWFNEGQPSTPDAVIAPLVPVDWKTAGTPIGPMLPTTGGGMNLPSQYGGILPAVMPAVATTVYKAPKGYVTVRIPNGNGQQVKVFMQKKAATALGLYKNRVKAPISGKEYRYIKKAKAWEAKLARMMGDSCNYKITKKR